MTSLSSKQMQFAKMTVHLFVYLLSNGYTFTYGDAYRDPRCPYGHKDSLHRSRLAIDLNIFRDGKYLAESGQYNDIGEFWESMGGAWGGRFGDDNHFSLEHKGMK